MRFHRLRYNKICVICAPNYGSGICLVNSCQTITKSKFLDSKIGWKKSTTHYFKEKFLFESSYLDKQLLEYIARIRDEGIKCFLATDQNKYRSKFLLNELGFNKKFDGHFISCNLGYRKIHQQYWEKVINNLKQKNISIKEHMIFFFDDMECNLQIAKENGIKTVLINNSNSLNIIKEIVEF